jgi:hypothetical protein
MGTRARLGVALKTEGRPVVQREALQAAVEQTLVGDAGAARECPGIDREAVVLTGDHDLT